MITTEYKGISGHFDSLEGLIGGLDELCAYNIESLKEGDLVGDGEGAEKYTLLFERTEELCKYHYALNKSHERLNETRQVMLTVASDLTGERPNETPYGKSIRVSADYEKISGYFDSVETLIGGLDVLCAYTIENLGDGDLVGDGGWPEKFTFLFERTEELCKHHKALNKSQERLNEIRQVMVTVANELGVWEEEASASPHGKSITVILTDSMIRNKMLTLTDAKNSGLVKIGDEFKIKFPNGKEITTELVGPNNRLKERGAFRDFYSEHGLKAGSKLRLTFSDESKSWKINALSPGIGFYADGKSMIDFFNDL